MSFVLGLSPKVEEGCRTFSVTVIEREMGTRRSTRISNSDVQKHSQNPGLDTSQGKWLTLDWDIKEQTPFRLPRKRGGLPFGYNIWLYESGEFVNFEIPCSIRDEVLLEPPPPFKLIHANAYPSSIPRVELGEAHICGCSAIGERDGSIQKSSKSGHYTQMSITIVITICFID